MKVSFKNYILSNYKNQLDLDLVDESLIEVKVMNIFKGMIMFKVIIPMNQDYIIKTCSINLNRSGFNQFRIIETKL